VCRWRRPASSGPSHCRPQTRPGVLVQAVVPSSDPSSSLSQASPSTGAQTGTPASPVSVEGGSATISGRAGACRTTGARARTARDSGAAVDLGSRLWPKPRPYCLEERQHGGNAAHSPTFGVALLVGPLTISHRLDRLVGPDPAQIILRLDLRCRDTGVPERVPHDIQGCPERTRSTAKVCRSPVHRALDAGPAREPGQEVPGGRRRPLARFRDHVAASAQARARVVAQVAHDLSERVVR
jgi:hypothetical protein